MNKRYTCRDCGGQAVTDSIDEHGAPGAAYCPDHPSAVIDSPPPRYTWTVEFQVDASWVADGFDLTDQRALAMLANDLRYAYEHELGARVISAPDAKRIRREQGYEGE